MLVNVAVSLALASGALAAPRALTPSRSTEELRAVWKYYKDSSSISLAVYNSDKSIFYGEADGSSIDSGSFAHYPLTFDVDNIGFGKVTFGNSTYLTRDNRKHSGGAICHRKFNADEAEVDCWLPSPAGFEPEAVYGAEKRQLQGIIPCQPKATTYMVGDGDPHQNYYHKQISENIFCGASPSCAVGYEQSESYTIGFSVSGDITSWLSGGFDVQKSWETGNSYTCYGAVGDTVCVWYNTAHTAYTVRSVVTQQQPCSNPVETVSDPVVIKSPNSNNRGGGYYCVIGTCRAKGDAYWDDNGPAGGPQ
ncbi:hypothetical protein QQX98_003636 [Neonectria punicea]|uniref:Uncharacterized protein n=1 Tax=Neonectria punicea TaxID=979145 RepID=A0ABR1HCP7_9HYPO